MSGWLGSWPLARTWFSYAFIASKPAAPEIAARAEHGQPGGCIGASGADAPSWTKLAWCGAGGWYWGSYQSLWCWAASSLPKNFSNMVM
jgi:hypothetical protein